MSDKKLQFGTTKRCWNAGRASVLQYWARKGYQGYHSYQVDRSGRLAGPLGVGRWPVPENEMVAEIPIVSVSTRPRFSDYTGESRSKKRNVCVVSRMAPIEHNEAPARWW